MALPSREEIYEDHKLEYFLYDFKEKTRVQNFNRQLYTEVCKLTHGMMVPVTSNGNNHEEFLQYSVEHYFNDAYYICTKLTLDLNPESHFLEEYYNTIEGNALDHWLVFTMVYWMLLRNLAIRPQYINMMNTLIDFLLDDRYFYVLYFMVAFKNHEFKPENLNIEFFPVKSSFVDTDEIFRTPIIRVGEDANDAEKEVYDIWCKTRSFHAIRIGKKMLPPIIEKVVQDYKENNNIKKVKTNRQVDTPSQAYTDNTFNKSAILTDIQIDLVLAELIVVGWMPKETCKSDFHKLFSGVKSDLQLTWLGTAGELHDFFDMLTKKKKDEKNKKKLSDGYITPRGNYLNIVCSHFKDKNGNDFKDLNHKKRTKGSKDILTLLEIFINYSVDKCAKMMKEIISEHKDLLEEFDLSVKPEHHSHYGRSRKGVK